LQKEVLRLIFYSVLEHVHIMLRLVNSFIFYENCPASGNNSMNRNNSFAFRLCLLAVMACLAGMPLPAFAQYRLQKGDVLEFSVAGLPELKQRLTVGIAGEISVPLLGQINVSGLPLDDVRKRIIDTAPNFVFTQMTDEGREVPRVVSTREISLAIADYRPIYLRGDVAKPGEQPFRPGLTIRQAIAIAGGFDIIRFRMGNPVLDSADLRSDYNALWAELVREEARLQRISTELGQSVYQAQFPRPPISEELLHELRKNENTQFNVRTENLKKEKSHLESMISKAEDRLRTLVEKRKASESGRKDDMIDYERVRELFNKGMTPTTRLSEARRSVLISETQVLQTISEISQAERQRDVDSRQRVKLDEDRRAELLTEAQDTRVKMAQVESKIQATSEKLVYTAALQSQLTHGTSRKPEVIIFRKGEAGAERIAADEDTELFPGDVIEVVLKADLASLAAGQ
jgi:polysaccharide export outer membrane protein